MVSNEVVGYKPSYPLLYLNENQISPILIQIVIMVPGERIELSTKRYQHIVLPLYYPGKLVSFLTFYIYYIIFLKKSQVFVNIFFLE